ncbi:hypothetical protein [Marinobacterium litorale]|uniref:hypothetical protein n=1 Tax=Marinobacterium litorale TaxID=404770 RepID=UPI0003F97B04|nr:hypothetical protein [Marinobacterium litorale]
MFDAQAFSQQQFERRQAEVSLPDLAPFFPDDEKPVFVVQMLGAEELSIADEATQKHAILTEITTKLAAGSAPEKAAALAEALGISSDDIPARLKKEMEHVRLGLVSPQLDLQQVQKLARHYPIPFRQLHNKIMELTGQGATAKAKP